MADSLYLSQFVVENLGTVLPGARLSQFVLETLGQGTGQQARLSQFVLENAGQVTTQQARLSQYALECLYVDCSSPSYVPPPLTGEIVLTATAGATDERWVDVGWTALEGFTFTLERGTASGVYDTTLLTGSTATSFHDTAVDFHVTYYYRVTGTNVCGDETASNEGSATLSCTLPSAPMGFIAQAGQLPHQVILRWTVLGGMTYEIQRNNVTLASGLTEIPYIDSDVPSGFVQYSLSVLNDCGWGEDAAHITIQAPGCTPWSGAVVPCTGWTPRT
jgi:hypothetical protein